MFKHDYTGVKEFGEGFDPIPEGDYNFLINKVKEQKTKNGDNMVAITLDVADGPNAGRKVFHNVVFLPKDHKAAGMSKHFLHVIGQPYEGMVAVNSDNWLDAPFRAHVKIVEYNGKQKNEVDEVYLDETPATNSDGKPLAGDSDDNQDVPF